MKRIALLTVIAITAVTLTGSGHASIFDKLRNKDTAPGKSMTLAGEYTGSLQGKITVKGQSFVVTRNTRIYVVGKGPAEPGLFLTRQPVVVMSTTGNGLHQARMIVVRPASGTTLRTPTTPVMGTASDSNPDVGVLAVEAAD